MIKDHIFWLRFFSRNNDHNFSAKNLLSSFNLEIFSILKDFRILINPIKKSSPVYIESVTKNIKKSILWIFKKEKVIIDSIDFKTKLLKIFHVFLNIPTYYKMKNSFFQELNLNKTLWQLSSLQLDHIIISKIGEKNLDTLKNKQIKSTFEGKSFENKGAGGKKKIRIDHFTLIYTLILYNDHKSGISKKKKECYRKIKASVIVKKFNSIYLKGDILIEKNTNENFIIIDKIDENYEILSLKNQKFSFETKELKIRFGKLEIKNPDLQRFYDKDGRVLLLGNRCQIKKGYYKDTECVILFHSQGILFVSLLKKQNHENIIIVTYSDYVCLNLKTISEIGYSPIEYSELVTITKGQFKGYRCKVLKNNNEFLEVIILSISKMIKISKNNTNL